MYVLLPLNEVVMRIIETSNLAFPTWLNRQVLCWNHKYAVTDISMQWMAGCGLSQSLCDGKGTKLQGPDIVFHECKTRAFVSDTACGVQQLADDGRFLNSNAMYVQMCVVLLSLNVQIKCKVIPLCARKMCRIAWQCTTDFFGWCWQRFKSNDMLFCCEVLQSNYFSRKLTIILLYCVVLCCVGDTCTVFPNHILRFVWEDWDSKALTNSWPAPSNLMLTTPSSSPSPFCNEYLWNAQCAAQHSLYEW